MFEFMINITFNQSQQKVLFNRVCHCALSYAEKNYECMFFALWHPALTSYILQLLSDLLSTKVADALNEIGTYMLHDMFYLNSNLAKFKILVFLHQTVYMNLINVCKVQFTMNSTAEINFWNGKIKNIITSYSHWHA